MMVPVGLAGALHFAARASGREPSYALGRLAFNECVQHNRERLRGRARAMSAAGRIGPYRILDKLGEGAMGVVYRARHDTSGSFVALKTIKVPTLQLLDGIRREIHALSRIRHPGVVRIVDDGLHEGAPWYAMDLLEGESLRHFGDRVWSAYRRPPSAAVTTERISLTQPHPDGHDAGADLRALPPLRPTAQLLEVLPAAAGSLSVVLGLVRRLCATLAFLHGEGFINCDLKPENVLIVGDQPVIIDFGLTMQHPGGSGREALEVHRGVAGTVQYMSPEQARGEFVDARSDLYSIGCVLYELVVGEPPFSGTRQNVLALHMSSAPVPPSARVADVSPELERVMLKLLEKDVKHRFGYADEVAVLLAELAGDEGRLPEAPPARSYLYRPRLVGREAVVSSVRAVRDRTLRGEGALVLVGGESGVGKTRLAMELTRGAGRGRMQIVSSEAGPSAGLSTRGGGQAPFHMVRPILQAIGDRCRLGGAEVTERLLGERRAALAMYEPALARLPGPTLSAPPPLPLEQARQRLFNYVGSALQALARELPVFWLLDDLHWADDLSISFLRWLTPEFLASTPVFVLGTYRSDEQAALAGLMGRSHVTDVFLPRLDGAGVQAIVEDMLAVPAAPAGFLEFVASETEGNPFFVAEYLRTAVSERVLRRDRHYSWQFAIQPEGAVSDYRALPLPRSLRAVIERRLGDLSPEAQEAAVAAAVLGRDVDVDTLRETTELSEAARESALDELLRRQVFEQRAPGHLRFVHDKMREVAYGRAPAAHLQELHARAARSLEARWTGSSDPHWATLARHFASAQLPERAAHYFGLAAEHARANHAPVDAIPLYQEAIAQINQLRGLEGEPGVWNAKVRDLHEALGDVLNLVARRDESRSSYERALALAPPESAAARARVRRKIGKTWEVEHQDERAQRLYDEALEGLGAEPPADSPEQQREWIQCHLDKLHGYYWLRRVPEMNREIALLRVPLEQHGSLQQRARFFSGQMLMSMRRDRYVVTDETLRFAREARHACQGDEQLADLPLLQFGYGFALLFHRSWDDASDELGAALAMARRAGDFALEARCLVYLAVTARLRRQVSEAERLTRTALEASLSAQTREYVAAARGNEAWLALWQGDLETSAGKARLALDTWRAAPPSHVFPFQWLALLPQLEASLHARDLEQAAACAAGLLAPEQQLLDLDADVHLVNGTRAWAAGDADGATSSFQSALTIFDRAGYR
jgi:serine/threonine protein kinase/tetratricopeptide (TPR) repeat protein